MYVMFTFAPRPDGGGAFPDASPTIHEICGIAPEQVRDDAALLFERIEPDDLARLRAAIARSTREGTPWDLEFRYRHPSKGLVWMRAHCTPLVGQDGNLQWHGFINDITRRRETDEQLRRFAFLVSNSQDFIAMCDLGGRPLYVNEAGLALVGLSGMKEARGLSIEDFFFSEDRAQITNEFLPAVRCEGHGTVEIRFRHFRTEDPIWMSFSVFTLKDGGEQPIGFATISQSIGARKQDDERMELLINELNHRVRNTLAIVNAIATQTMKHTPSVQEFRRAFGGRIAALAKTLHPAGGHEMDGVDAAGPDRPAARAVHPRSGGRGADRRTTASRQSEAGAYAQPGDPRAGRQRGEVRRLVRAERSSGHRLEDRARAQPAADLARGRRAAGRAADPSRLRLAAYRVQHRTRVSR